MRAMPRQGLIVKEKWGVLIVHGRSSDGKLKTWEIRGSGTKKVGQRIGIIVGKELLGEVTLAACFPLDETMYNAHVDDHQHATWADVALAYKKPHIWVLEDVVSYAQRVDVSVFRKQGQVKWVNLFLGKA